MRDAATLVLLLRFRDLVDPQEGSTIREHRKLVEQHGYVWWAWWRKQSEAFPLELWRDIRTQAREGGVVTWLVDSGYRKLYRTTIHDVHLDLGNGVAAPENGRFTPAYYNQQAFTCWFKLGVIDDAPVDAVREFAYARVPDDDLVKVESDLFVGHRIDGIDQLLEFGNVTYWVATPAAQDAAFARGPHKRYPVPVIAPRQTLTAQEPRVLHISDLHVAPGLHAFELERADTFNKSLPVAVHAALQGRLPGVVVVSGDLTWSGAQSEFDLAYACLDALRSALGLTHDDFIIVPGNHDIRWTKEQKDKDAYDYLGRVELAKDEAQAHYRRFFEKWYGRRPNDFLSVGRRFFLTGGPSVDILGVNSTAVQQVEGAFAGVGCVTRAALESSARAMEWDGEEAKHLRATDLRMLVLHHHLLPVVMQERPSDARRGFGVALDAGEILQTASRFGVDLVLHGHQHQPFVGHAWCESIAGSPIAARRPLLVAGCGSTGIVNEHQGPIQQRCFNLIELRRSQVTLDLFATPQEARTFERTATVTAAWGSHWERGGIQ